MQQLGHIHLVRSWLSDPARQPACVEVPDVSEVCDELVQHELPGSLFLGCDLPRDVAAHLVSTGATVIGAFPSRAFQVHRANLYTSEELFEGFDPEHPDSHLDTLDHRIYLEYLDDGGPDPWNISISLARRLHDHAITDGIRALTESKRVVAIMGGHNLERADPMYGQVARISRALCRHGYLLASGGGPGAMEATHVGAWFAPRGDDDLEAALSGAFAQRKPGAPPKQEYADADWLHRAMALREAFPQSPEETQRYPSLGIPTWLYGHEPPAPFATHIAKYFANSVREDGLLALAKHGVVFAPGSAGTIQEIFQDLTQNHYGTHGVASPMVLFGGSYWTETKPVWPLVSQLAVGQRWGELLSLTSDPDEVVATVLAYEPLLHLSGNGDLTLESSLRRQLGLRSNVQLRHLAEPSAPSQRDLADDDAVREAVAHLLVRMQRHCTVEEVLPSLGEVHRQEDSAANLADWLTEFISDDWLDPTQALLTLRAFGEAGRLGTIARLPTAPTAGLLPGTIPSNGLLVRCVGGRLSMWVGGLAD